MLYRAIERDMMDVAFLLVQRGANPTLKDKVKLNEYFNERMEKVLSIFLWN